MTTRKTVFRRGDSVIVRVPEVVVRVGYPKTVKDYYREVEEKAGVAIDHIFVNLFNVRAPGSSGLVGHKLRHEVAYALAKQRGFGGPVRSVHTRRVEAFSGLKAKVVGVRSARTGTYYAPWGGYEDAEPGGLDNAGTTRIVSVDLDLSYRDQREHEKAFGLFYGAPIEFCAEHLDKIEPTEVVA